jgi:hypothetical protein
MSKVCRHGLILGLIACTAASVYAPDVAKAQTSLKVIVFPTLSNLSLFAAQKEGYFSKRGLAVEIQNTPNSEVLRTGLAKGEYHIAHAAVDNAVDMADVGKVDIAIIMGGEGGFAFPVAILEADGRQFLFSPFGEVNWVHNLRATGEAVIRRGRTNHRMTAVELTPEIAAPILEAGMEPVLGAPVFGSMIAGWYGLDRNSTTDDYLVAARQHPGFELCDAAA